MIKNIVATNSIGLSYRFDDINRIVNGLDLSGLGADVNYLETTLGGSRYQNTKLKNREFDIEARISRLNQTEELMDAQRERMYKVFNPELNPIYFDFELTDGTQYYLTAYATSTPRMAPDKGNNNAAYQRALLQFICTDPYLYQGMSLDIRTGNGIGGSRTEIATWVGNIEFDLEIPEDGIEVEYRTQNATQNVIYNGDARDGMVIRFRATGPVTNPRIINVQTYETVGLNFEMQTDDIISINTYRGERSITLLRNGERTNIFSAFDLRNSVFLQLNPGDNIIRFEADIGQDFLEVAIDYRIRKVGI